MLVDKNLDNLAEFLKEELNLKAEQYLKDEGIEKLVNTIYAYKARQNPLINHPSLMIYRNTELYMSETKQRSQIVINYTLTHTRKINISPLIGFVSMALNNALNLCRTRFTEFTIVDGGRRSETGVIYNDNNAGIEIYINMYFDILEGSIDYQRYVS